VLTIAAQLIDSGEVKHAYLGITMVAVSNGVAVTRVRSGTPAEDAGLKAATGTETVDGQAVPAGGDVIVAFDGVAVTSSAQLQGAVDAKRPGDTASLTIIRGGKRRTVEVTLAERPEQPS
jgi:S1-C subfamily serine protease